MGKNILHECYSLYTMHCNLSMILVLWVMSTSMKYTNLNKYIKYECDEIVKLLKQFIREHSYDKNNDTLKMALHILHQPNDRNHLNKTFKPFFYIQTNWAKDIFSAICLTIDL